MGYSIRYDYGFDGFAAYLRARQSLALFGSLGRLRPYVIGGVLFVLLYTIGMIMAGRAAELLSATFLVTFLAGLFIIMTVIAIHVAELAHA